MIINKINSVKTHKTFRVYVFRILTLIVCHLNIITNQLSNLLGLEVKSRNLFLFH